MEIRTMNSYRVEVTTTFGGQAAVTVEAQNIEEAEEKGVQVLEDLHLVAPGDVGKSVVVSYE